MSINENKKNSVTIPTISSFVKFICTMLDVKIPQNKEVITARTITYKLLKFNNNGTEGEGTFEKVINHLLGLPFVFNRSKCFISKEEEFFLQKYKQIITEHIEFIETIISSMQNHILYKSTSSTQLKKDIIKYFVTPFLVIFHDIGGKLPPFVPVMHLSDIVISIFSHKERNTLSIVKEFLRKKAKSLLKKHHKNQDYDIFKHIKSIKYSSIPSAQSVYEYSIDFLEAINFQNLNKEKYDQSKIYDFMGAFYCCSIILRLKKQLEDESVFNNFIYDLVIMIWIYQTNGYPHQYEDEHKLILKINDDENELMEEIDNGITSFDANEYFDIYLLNYELIEHFLSYINKMELLSLVSNNGKIVIKNKKNNIEHSGVMKINFKLDELTVSNCLNPISTILKKISYFQPCDKPDLVHFISKGIESDRLNDNTYLVMLLDELNNNDTNKYEKGITLFIKAIIALKAERIDDAISFCELIINQESKKWHLGKIKSDTLIIYIGLRIIKKKLRSSEKDSLLALYHECKPVDLIFELIDHNQLITDNYITTFTYKVLVNNFNKLIDHLKLDPQKYCIL